MLEYLEKLSLLLPVLPYAAIAFVIYQVMSRFVKPVVASHKGLDGKHHEALWLNLRRGMVFYPMALGYLASLALPHLSWGYCVTAGAASQTLYLILRKVLKARLGVTLPPPDNKTML